MDKNSNLPCAVILTALPVEYQAVRIFLTRLHEEAHPQGTIYERGVFKSQSQSWDVGIVEIGAGNVGAAFEAERAINYFKPVLILFVGVAGGLKDVEVGDVVIATKVYGYESGKSNMTFETRPEVGNSTYRMEQRARAVARNNDWLQRLGTAIHDPVPKVLVAPIAAGEKVVGSTRSVTWKFLKANYGDALAVEMEGYGFLKAAHANQQVDALIIRGISDRIDDKAEADATNSQGLAAQHASAFAFEVLAKLGSDETFRSSLSRIRAAEKIKRSDFSMLNKRDQFQNYRPVQGSIQGGSNNTIHNVIMNTPSRDDVAEGRDYLKRGQTALSREDYTAARQHLETAAHLLQEDQLPEESAQVKYLLALALLSGQRPFGVTLQAWRRVEELMQGAITLHACYSYLYTFALFKQDFARNGWRKSQYIQDAQNLIEEASQALSSHVDNENLNLLWQCQPLLMQEAQ